MPDKNDLRVASDAFLARVNRLHKLEERKRELEPGSEQLLEAAQDVEALAAEVLEWAKRQTGLAGDALSEPDTDPTPIAVTPPRELSVILAQWRGAERDLEQETPGSAAWESVRADVDRLRDEYARAYRAHSSEADSLKKP